MFSTHEIEKPISSLVRSSAYVKCSQGVMVTRNKTKLIISNASGSRLSRLEGGHHEPEKKAQRLCLFTLKLLSVVDDRDKSIFDPGFFTVYQIHLREATLNIRP